MQTIDALRLLKRRHLHTTYGKMAKWQNGKMAKWQNGKMAKWQK